jgi:predicted dinucleotide-binding enzyme
VASGTPAQAASWGEVVALAVPWAAAPGALAEAGELSGKVLWDSTNTLLPDMTDPASENP